MILGDDAVFRYYWIEDDPGLDAPWPGDGRTISMRPGTADNPHRTLTRYEQEPTDGGCGANLTYTVFTYIQPD
ncbi:MAG: hypothetical protein QOK29_5109 [Rhodospirillaceae bacterium]|nr:hypothetical protein [Rhodospirillaceae bacterium]